MRRKIPSTQALQCFEAAARHESYTRAAQELALTQSAVSRQITALEEMLGVALFRRTRHGMTLTAEGSAYAKQIRLRLDALERDTQDVMTRQGSGGTLRLATVPTFATRWLLPRLARLRTSHPELVVHLETRTRPFLFADTGFDAAIYAGTSSQVNDWPGIHATQLLNEDVIVVCSPQLLAAKRRSVPGQEPTTLEPHALLEWPLLQISTRPDGWRRWFEAQGIAAVLTHQATAGPRYELFSMVAAAAVHGLGAALVPRLLVEPELQRGELVLACPARPYGDRAYYLVRPDHPTPSRALQSFSLWLQAQLSGSCGTAAGGLQTRG